MEVDTEENKSTYNLEKLQQTNNEPELWRNHGRESTGTLKNN